MSLIHLHQSYSDEVYLPPVYGSECLGIQVP